MNQMIVQCSSITRTYAFVGNLPNVSILPSSVNIRLNGENWLRSFVASIILSSVINRLIHYLAILKHSLVVKLPYILIQVRNYSLNKSTIESQSVIKCAA